MRLSTKIPYSQGKKSPFKTPKSITLYSNMEDIMRLSTKEVIIDYICSMSALYTYYGLKRMTIQELAIIVNGLSK